MIIAPLWVLVIIITSGLRDGGVAVNTDVHFTTQANCQAAAESVAKANESFYAVCVVSQ